MKNAAVAGIRGLGLRTLDRYLLNEMARPLAAGLAVILSALLLERILRLIDLVAAQGGPLGPVLQMALNLVPHYLGLALPAAFFISMFVVVARLADDAELEAMMGAGQSLRRIEMPFLLIAAVLTMISLMLYGFLQPYTRYAYRAIFNAVKEAGWSGEVPQGVFVDAGKGMTIFADAVDGSGQRMTRLFIHEQNPESEIITTAERGELVFLADRNRLSLSLYNGRQVRARDTAAAVIEFEHFVFNRDFSQEVGLFRPRGADEREMTLPELYEGIQAAEPGLPSRNTWRGELHGRLVRAASILVLPFFAVPMGLAAKRGRRGLGLVIAAVILVIYHHALQFGEGLVDLGKATPVAAIWGPFAVFSAFCIATTWRSDLKAGLGPFDNLLASLESAGGAIARALPMRWRSP
jgi:lipopolysaccharide export system permease protein